MMIESCNVDWDVAKARRVAKDNGGETDMFSISIVTETSAQQGRRKHSVVS